MTHTFAIPRIVKTLLSSSGESLLFTWTSGTTKNNAIAITKPKDPTDKNGNGNPPRLYRAEPTAGPEAVKYIHKKFI